MFAGSKRRAARPADPLEERFGLRRKGLKPGVRAALDSLIAENARLAALLAEAETLADRDPLTQAANRRAFMRALHQAMSFAERYATPAAVLFIDLDGFKAVNDGFGHAAGDAVLIHVARLLNTQVRESDVVGRIGGDEFGVILQHATLDDAHRKAEALARAFETQPAEHAGVTHRIAASIGVHGFAGLEDPETALARADEAMYAAKHLRKRAAAG